MKSEAVSVCCSNSKAITSDLAGVLHMFDAEQPFAVRMCTQS